MSEMFQGWVMTGLLIIIVQLGILVERNRR